MSKCMIKVSFQTAQSVWQMGDAEVYELHDDGSESLTDGDSLDGSIQYGIEGEIFGEVYDDK